MQLAKPDPVVLVASAEFNALKKELAKLVMEEQVLYTEYKIKSYTAD